MSLNIKDRTMYWYFKYLIKQQIRNNTKGNGKFMLSESRWNIKVENENLSCFPVEEIYLPCISSVLFNYYFSEIRIPSATN